MVALFLADSPDLFRNVAALFGSGAYVAPVVSISALVGFIGLGGVACRNGLLLISHYYHLMEEEGVRMNGVVQEEMAIKSRGSNGIRKETIKKFSKMHCPMHLKRRKLVLIRWLHFF